MNNGNLIYVLIGPRTGEFRYVGMTTKGAFRPKEHVIQVCNGEKSHKADWIHQLQALDLEYGIGVLEELENERDLPKAEIKWISCYRGMGARLTNMTDGGDGCLNPNDETKAKISATLKGNTPWNKGLKGVQIVSNETCAKISVASKRRWADPEYRAKMSAASKRRWANPKERARMSAANKDRKLTLEARAKMSVATKGKKLTPEHRAKLSIAGRGRKYTPETRAKISAANKGRRHSDETKAKMSTAHKGRKPTLETRKKLSEAAKRQWARKKVA